MNLSELFSIKTALYFSGLIAISIYVYRIDQRRKFFAGDALNWLTSENMPMDLCGASIHMSEKDISCASPTRLYGRVDQVFINNNLLIPVDTKTRKRHEVTKEDQIQLSSYGFILRHSQAIPVATYGYIRSVIVTPKGDEVKYIKVDLLCDEAVISIAQQHRRANGEGEGHQNHRETKEPDCAKKPVQNRAAPTFQTDKVAPTTNQQAIRISRSNTNGMPKGYIPFSQQ